MGIHDPRDRYHFTGSDEERDEKAEAMLTAMFGALRGEPQSEFPDFDAENLLGDSFLTAPIVLLRDSRQAQVGLCLVARPRKARNLETDLSALIGRSCTSGIG